MSYIETIEERTDENGLKILFITRTPHYIETIEEKKDENGNKIVILTRATPKTAPRYQYTEATKRAITKYRTTNAKLLSEKTNHRQKEQYHNDPEYREKKQEYNRQRAAIYRDRKKKAAAAAN
jgi:hypothetical protein